MSRDLILIAASLFAWGIGEGMFLFFQAIYLQRLGASPVAIGAILGGVGIFMTISQIPAGIISDRIGQRPVMWVSWFIGAIAAWVMALATSLNGFVAGVMMYGLSYFAMAPMNSYITGASGKWSVGRAITLVSAMFSLGAVTGPTIGGYLGERYGLKSVYVVAACFFVVSTIIMLFINAQSIKTRPVTENRGHLLTNRRFLSYLGVVFLTSFTILLPQSLTPNFLQYVRGVSLVEIGQLGSLSSLGSVLFSFTLGHMYPGVIYIVGQLFVGLFAFLLWQGTDMVWYGIGYFFMGGYRLCRTMGLAQARPLVRPNEIGFAYGIIETVNSITYMLAPVLAGLIYNFNPLHIYPITLGLVAVSLLVSGSFVFSTWRSSKAVPNPLEAGYSYDES